MQGKNYNTALIYLSVYDSQIAPKTAHNLVPASSADRQQSVPENRILRERD